MKCISNHSNLPSNSDNRNALTPLHDLSETTLTKIADLREHYPTIQSFGVAYSPAYLDKFSRYPTRCLFGSAPTLIELNLTYSPSASVQWLIAQLSSFQEMVNVQNKMTVYQIDSCAQIITERFGYLKTSEIMLFLSRLKGGLYGVEWFGTITPDKIVRALSENYMPYRNNLYYKHEKDEKDKRDAEQRNTPGITWEEYCRLKGIDKQNPLDNITSEQG